MLSRLPILAGFRWRANHSLWLLILLLSAVLQVAGLVQAWRFDRTLIAQGEVWLLFSGHFVHLNWTHWALNMAGLGIVAFFFSPYASLRQWLAVIFCAALFSGLGMYWRDPELQTYVGLSGVLHGLFIFGALREIRHYPVSGYVLLALLLGKLIWEASYGPLPGSEALTRGRVATDAHLYGALGGGVAALLLSARALFHQLVEIKNR
jgi:rhomboid family GlyGly-CTERM serine protease